MSATSSSSARSTSTGSASRSLSGPAAFVAAASRLPGRRCDSSPARVPAGAAAVARCVLGVGLRRRSLGRCCLGLARDGPRRGQRRLRPGHGALRASWVTASASAGAVVGGPARHGSARWWGSSTPATSVSSVVSACLVPERRKPLRLPLMPFRHEEPHATGRSRHPSVGGDAARWSRPDWSRPDGGSSSVTASGPEGRANDRPGGPLAPKTVSGAVLRRGSTASGPAGSR